MLDSCCIYIYMLSCHVICMTRYILLKSHANASHVNVSCFKDFFVCLHILVHQNIKKNIFGGESFDSTDKHYFS